MRNHSFKSFALIAWLLLIPTLGVADPVSIIVHPSISSELTPEQIKRIYMGKSSKFPDGTAAVPLVISHTDPAFNTFAREVLKRSPKQLKSYWAKRMFTGRSRPPQIVESFSKMIEMVASNPMYIGFYAPPQKEPSVKVLFVLEDS